MSGNPETEKSLALPERRAMAPGFLAVLAGYALGMVAKAVNTWLSSFSAAALL